MYQRHCSFNTYLPIYTSIWRIILIWRQFDPCMSVGPCSAMMEGTQALWHFIGIYYLLTTSCCMNRYLLGNAIGWTWSIEMHICGKGTTIGRISHAYRQSYALKPFVPQWWSFRTPSCSSIPRNWDFYTQENRHEAYTQRLALSNDGFDDMLPHVDDLKDWEV
jgi:hypothetical protein